MNIRLGGEYRFLQAGCFYADKRQIAFLVHMGNGPAVLLAVIGDNHNMIHILHHMGVGHNRTACAYNNACAVHKVEAPGSRLSAAPRLLADNRHHRG
ncbi:hypothetical protein D3C73_1351780 [compost metagenome]